MMLVQSFLIIIRIDVFFPLRRWEVCMKSSFSPLVSTTSTAASAPCRLNCHAGIWWYNIFVTCCLSEILITYLINTNSSQIFAILHRQHCSCQPEYLCVWLVRGCCSPAQKSRWLMIPTSEWSLCLIMKRLEFVFTSKLFELLTTLF